MEYGKRIAGYSYVADKDKIWFMAYGRDYICCYDLKSQHLNNFVVSKEYDLNCERQLYHKILKNGEWLLLIPRVGDDILLFNIDTYDCVHVDLPNHINIQDSKFVPDEAKFCSGFVYDEYFFLLGLSYPGILRVSKKDFSVELIDGWIEDVTRLINKEYIGYISLGSCICNSIAICPLICTQATLRIDLDTLETVVEQIDGPFTDGLYGLSGSEGDDLWATGLDSNDNLICHISKDKISTYGIEDIHGDVHIFYPPILSDFGLFLIPVQYEKKIYKFDSDNQVFRVWKQYEKIDGIRSISGYSFMEPLIEEDKLLVVDGQTYDWHIIECENGKELSFYIDVENNCIEKEFWKKKISIHSDNNSIIDESKISLELFLESI